MHGVLSVIGILIACVAAAAAILAPGARRQRLAIGVALAAAPLLVLGDVWDQPRVADLRESPGLVAAVLAALALALAAGVALIRRFEWAFPALVFGALAVRLPLQFGGETSNLLVPLYLVIASGFVASLRAVPAAPGAERGAVVWLRRVLAATLLLYAIQSSYTADLSNAIENVGFFLVPFAILFCQLSQHPWSATSLRATAIVAGLVGSGVALLAIGEYLARDLLLNPQLLDSNQLKPAFRVNSAFFDPNVLGRYLALGAIVLAAAVAWSRGEPLALAATAVGVLMLAGLALSYSITSIAAILAGFGVLAVLRYGLRGGLAASAAVALTAAVFALSGGADRSDIGPTRGIEEETSGRLDLLEGGLELISERPLEGWGSGAFGRAFFEQIRETETTASHSEPLSVAAEQGVPGALLYLALLGTVLRVLLSPGARASATLAAVAAGVVALIVHSLGYAGFLTDPATWALVAVGIGVRAAGAPG